MAGKLSQESSDNPLGKIIRDSGITRQEAADLLHVSLHTVNAWLKPRGAKSSLRLHPWAARLLELELKELAKGGRAVETIPGDPTPIGDAVDDVW